MEGKMTHRMAEESLMDVAVGWTENNQPILGGSLSPTVFEVLQDAFEQGRVEIRDGRVYWTRH